MKWQFVFILSFFSLISLAQDDESGRLFKAGVVVGFNASQLDGDRFRGYSKLGLHAGLIVKYQLPSKPKVGLGVEMLFSMKGSSEDLNFASTTNTQFKVKMNYIEIPLIVSYKEWNIDFHAGVSYGRLISASTEILTTSYSESDFRKDDMNVLLGATYIFLEDWGVTLRYSHSFVNAVKKDVNKDALVGHLLTFRVEYLF
jgi:hypothetical protein